MADATVLDRIYTFPAFDIVSLTAKEGDTYQSKLSNIVSAVASSVGGASAVNATWSGRTVTINSLGGGLASGTVSLIIAGRL